MYTNIVYYFKKQRFNLLFAIFIYIFLKIVIKIYYNNSIIHSVW